MARQQRTLVGARSPDNVTAPLTVTLGHDSLIPLHACALGGGQ